MGAALANRRVLQASLVCFALFVPFSIAGMNIALGFGLLAWLLDRTVFRNASAGRAGEPVPARRDPLLLASLALVAFAIPSVIISENRERALGDWSSYWELAICFFVARNVLREDMRALVFRTLAVSAAISCVVAIAQRLGGIDFGFLRIDSAYRVSSTLYTMTFAGILYQLIVLNLAVLLTRGMRLRARVLLASVVALQFVAIKLTETRGAWLALVGGIVALALLVRARFAAWAAAVLVAGLALFAFLGSGVQQGRSIPELFRSGLDKDAATRVVLWDIAWDLFRAHPVLGVGMGDYTTEADRLLHGRRVTTTVDTHNVYLHVLATRGLVGFVPFVAFWVVLLRSLFRIRRGTEARTADHQFAAGAIAAVVAVLVGALTELNVDDGEVFMAFMLVLGLALSPAAAEVRQPERRAT